MCKVRCWRWLIGNKIPISLRQLFVAWNHGRASVAFLLAGEVQGYLAHKKPRPLRTLQKDYAQGPMEVLRGGAVSYERGTPVCETREGASSSFLLLSSLELSDTQVYEP